MNIIVDFFVLSGLVLSIFVFLDAKKHKQAMPIMGIVWPLTMLWASWIGLAAYLSFGRQKNGMNGMDMDMSAGKMDMDMSGNMDMDHSMDMGHSKKPKWQGVALSTLHCGAGCVLADIIGETLSARLGLTMLSGWGLDYIFALFFGVYFQYMAIQQMQKAKLKTAFNRAVKSDFLSLSAWQVGMYGLMGIYFLFSPESDVSRASFEFWFVMQLAMIAGFICSYPMNIYLIKKGLKHSM